MYTDLNPIFSVRRIVTDILSTLRIEFPELRFGVRQHRERDVAQTYLVAIDRENRKGVQIPLRLYAYFRKMRELHPELDLDDLEADLYARLATKIGAHFFEDPSDFSVTVAAADVPGTVAAVPALALAL